ncbi:pyridoxamine 5'-phosphate oxidase family protein [Streptomyces hainanensis]|uniref:Pyridoxamine 5'-phosphate oxidase family protein n=2 Tax=Streptomyces hainanensis TaxID=402648 RepID=A0A4R4TFI4_9ACTN|nr:pyridoxamine 5'-phosphate oxidase family protein [Streptomyces hainanensis]
MIEISGSEALWLLAGAMLGRLIFTQRETTVVRPAWHVWEYSRLALRSPVRAASLPETVTYHVDEANAHTGTGWMVTVSGPIEAITDPHEAAHYRGNLSGWTHGPHDALLRIRARTVSGFRLVQAAGE